MDLEQTFLKIIEKKHKELNLGQDYNAIFSKIRDFEANAIGADWRRVFKKRA
ncbi:hypothetical protein KVC58_04965 [Helicobacter pylori]|nr:hypothetical protein KVC58_04965 [Helicobacter pylori]